MSIPPLVCSTPPPPEQCEDDRDGEDFDIQYSLSQDDEDDRQDYTYGTYSDYMYSTSTSTNIHQDIWSSNISKKTDDKLCSDLLDEKKDTVSVSPTSNSSSVNKVVFEDTVLEDLNLKLEDQNDQDKHDQASLEQNVNTFEIESFRVDYGNDSSKQPIHIVGKNEDGNQFTSIQDLNEETVNDDIKPPEKNEAFLTVEAVAEEYTQEILDVATVESIKSNKETIIQSVDDMNPEVTEPTNFNKLVIDPKSLTVTESPECKIPVTDHENIINTDLKSEYLSDDDFGEFDDFQFISSENNGSTTITYCDNPWKTEVAKNCDFGNFTATFDVDNTNLCSTNNLDENSKINPKLDGSDDFGDFDDFKSSSNDNENTTPIKSGSTQNVPVLSLHSPDSEIQIIESINSVLSSIFTSEILEFESDFEGKLESSLNETWGYLVDTDVRQSYIVNWNNSLGQKSLLKALCIDSRNILFGPKWNNNMPKYAANLTVAPLQPQKPVTPINTGNTDNPNIEKTANKETGTWTDPFTSDGQEYTYAEALLLDLEHLMATLDQMAHKHSSFKISELLTNACNSENESTAAVTRPANLDVFTNVISPEMGHIYSSTLTVQPIRQINLPDTHIFTPTDSETPRSKTIHYDQAPTVLVPQPSEEKRQLDELTSKSKSEVSELNTENDEEYWEFQDFKGNSVTSSKNDSNSVNKVINTSTTLNTDSLPQIIRYETQILQPIKVEPIAPALNWPDPGEVKETFDDFTEFVSNALWTNGNTNISNQTDSHLNNKPEGGVKIEDDFETFQSGPSLKCTITSMDTPGTTTIIDHHNFKSHDFRPSVIDTSETSRTANYKTDSIISTQVLTPNESPLSSSDNFADVRANNEKTSPVLSAGIQRINVTLMQPSTTNTSNTCASQRNQQKSDQILQPLSLESYSQINWPSPGIDLQDLSRFNPVESLQSLKTDLSTGVSSKLSSPVHKDINTARNETSDEDIWGEFVSSKPKQQQQQPKKVTVFADDDEWTDFVSSPSVKPQNGLNTISLNVHTNLNMQKSLGQNKFHTKNNQLTLDIPTLKYVTPKSTNRGLYNEKHFQNL